MRRSPIRLRSALTAFAACALIAATGTATAAAARSDGVKTLRFTVADVKATVVDLGPAGKSPGDLYVYDGILKQGSKRIGKIYGSNTSLKLEGDREIVQGQLSFDFGGGDSILVVGVSAYPSEGPHGFIPGETFGRVVVGGTGIYAGARGNVATTRRPDDTYKHVVRLYR